MKKFEVFLFHTDDQTAGDCVAWLESLGISPTESEVELNRGSRGNKYCWVDVRLPSNDDRPRRLARAIEQGRGRDLTHREEINYAKSDYLAAVACALAAPRNMKIRSGAIYGTQYDWSKACPECGVGRMQLGPLVAKRSQLPKGRPIVQSEDEEYLISQRLRDELLAKVPGVGSCFGPIVENRTREPIDYWQVVPGYTMPPMHSSTLGILTDDKTESPRRCRTCGRNGYFGDGKRSFQPVYQMQETEQAKITPFAQTWEHMGFSHINVDYVDAPKVARAGLIVRRDVVAVMLEMNIRGTNLTPIGFINA